MPKCVGPLHGSNAHSCGADFQSSGSRFVSTFLRRRSPEGGLISWIEGHFLSFLDDMCTMYNWYAKRTI
jgi:hypothetical protein